MRERARFATPRDFLPPFKHLLKECSDKFYSDLWAGCLCDRGRLLRRHAGLSATSGSHLSSLVLKPHLHHPNAEPRLRSQGLPHLEAPRQTRFQHLAVKKAVPASPRPRIPRLPCPLFDIFSFFWKGRLNECSGRSDLLIIGSSKRWRGSRTPI